jgi:hypothetical protein
MSLLYIGLCHVVQANVADWRRCLRIILDGLRPRPDRAS